MFVNTHTLFAVLAASAALMGARAQSSSAVPTNIPGATPCVVQCFQQAASQGGCSSITDLSCVCSSSAFQNAAQSCLVAQCATTDIQAALQLQQNECGSTSEASGSASTTADASATSALSSAAASISSALSSEASSASSGAGSAAASASSHLSSVAASISSHVSSSASAASTSAAGAANAASVAAPFGSGGIFAAGVAVIGAVVGGALVL